MTIEPTYAEILISRMDHERRAYLVPQDMNAEFTARLKAMYEFTNRESEEYFSADDAFFNDYYDYLTGGHFG